MLEGAARASRFGVIAGRALELSMAQLCYRPTLQHVKTLLAYTNTPGLGVCFPSFVVCGFLLLEEVLRMQVRLKGATIGAQLPTDRANDRNGGDIASTSNRR